MGIEGLDYRIINIPFTSGLKTKDDQRAMQPPGLAICSDARFDDLGGIQTRYPFVSIGNQIFGGGTLSNCRRLAVVNDELCVFTDTALYSWDAELGLWIRRDTHLGVTIDYQSRFATNGDQIGADRAELNGTIVYCWSESTAQLFVAAISKATGAVLMPPTAVSGTNLQQGRLVALSTKILLFVNNSGANTLKVYALDPAAPAAGLASPATVTSTCFLFWDVVRIPGTDQAVGVSMLTTVTTYLAFSVTAGLVIATSTKARTCDGGIAVAVRPGNAVMHVFRSVSATTAVQGDTILISGLGDVIVNQAIGTFSGNMVYLTACYRSQSTGGHFVCVAFWNDGAAAYPNVDCKFNTVDDVGTIGTQATFVSGLTIASRAFDRAGSVFVNMLFDAANKTPAGFGARLNNVYLLYREDGTLHGKAIASSAGSSNGLLQVRAGVVSPGGGVYYWAGAIRRSVSQQASDPFGARSVVDIAISFDSKAGRRVAQIGRTGYISGAEILQYDGVRLVECGFNVFQYAIVPADAGAGTGSMAAGTYDYKSTFSYLNGQREFERSTTGAIASVVVAAGGSSTTTAAGVIGQLFTTRKTASPPTVDVWRTAVNPDANAPFYLASSLDPNAANPNRYLQNAVGGIPTFIDALDDATLTTRAANEENGAVLERLAPPPAEIIVATDTRLFLARIAGDPDRVWYSRLRADGEVVSFHDSLTIDIPRTGGDLTAIAVMTETLIAFREHAIYALPGVGFDNGGQGQNFGPAHNVSVDVGAVHQDAVALTPQGLMFKTAKGWYLLDHGWNPRYIGADVARFDGETINAVHVVEAYHQVRVVTSARILMYDYLVGAWSSWSISDAVHACVWNGVYYYLSNSNNAPMQEQTSFAASTGYGLDVELGWVKPADLQGFVRVDKILVLGEFRGACSLRIRTAFDYQQDGAGNWVYTDDVFWPVSPSVVGSALQVARGTTRGRCEAIKVRLTASSPANDGTPPTTEAIKITGIALKVGFRKQHYQRLPAAQKT